MSPVKIRRVHLDTGAEAYPLTGEILSRLRDDIPRRSGRKIAEDMPVDRGKESLHLLPFKGAFLKPCPGTRGYICCGYQILNLGTNCPLDCSYCILQSYFYHQPQLKVFVNLEEALGHVLREMDGAPERLFRVGTGEFMDSLALDALIRWSEFLLPRFSKRKNALLELKTKTAQVDTLLGLQSRDRIVVSWSLNSPTIAKREEHGSASLRARLKAAARCQSEGFILGFHFDPMIHHPGWPEDYARTLDLMDRFIDPKGIIWVSMGSFRFTPELKGIIRKRHPRTSIFQGEFIPGLDGKMRYFKPIRTELYARLRGMLETWHKNLGLYLCMESDDVWIRSLGWSPGDTKGLTRYLDQRVREVFGSNPEIDMLEKTSSK